jgi:hypothetical protein
MSEHFIWGKLPANEKISTLIEIWERISALLSAKR